MKATQRTVPLSTARQLQAECTAVWVLLAGTICRRLPTFNAHMAPANLAVWDASSSCLYGCPVHHMWAQVSEIT